MLLLDKVIAEYKAGRYTIQEAATIQACLRLGQELVQNGRGPDGALFVRRYGDFCTELLVEAEVGVGDVW